MAKKYKIKNGEKSFTHPVLGIVTQEHMEGPKAEVFMKALQNCEKNHKCKPASEWIEGA